MLRYVRELLWLSPVMMLAIHSPSTICCGLLMYNWIEVSNLNISLLARWLFPMYFSSLKCVQNLYKETNKKQKNLNSVVHTGPHNLALQSQCWSMTVFSLCCHRVPWLPPLYYHFLLGCHQAKAPLTCTLVVLLTPASCMHSHPVCYNLGLVLSCPVWLWGDVKNDCMLLEMMPLTPVAVEHGWDWGAKAV